MSSIDLACGHRPYRMLPIAKSADQMAAEPASQPSIARENIRGDPAPSSTPAIARIGAHPGPAGRTLR